jgi:hypothetical protein
VELGPDFEKSGGARPQKPKILPGALVPPKMGASPFASPFWVLRPLFWGRSGSGRVGGIFQNLGSVWVGPGRAGLEIRNLGWKSQIWAGNPEAGGLFLDVGIRGV